MLKKVIRSLFRSYGFDIVPRRTIAMDARRMREFVYLTKLYPEIKNVAGTIVECGLGWGKSFLMLSYLASVEGNNRVVWGFDSFEGFPEPSKEDASVRNPKKGEWAVSKPEDIRLSLKVAGLSDAYVNENIRLIPGFFCDSMPKYDGSPIAILHVDADLYYSYKDVLNALAPRVSPGGLILFDEYGQETDWPGATQAVEEFIAATKSTIEHDTPSNRYFIRVPAAGLRFL